MTTTTVPEFDAEAFGKWLRRWKDAERLEWGDIAARGGLHVSTVQHLARGVPSSKGVQRGQRNVNPPINTLARIAVGLGLELTYVLSKAKLIDPSDAGRWSNFSDAERVTMARALCVVPEHLRTPVEVRLVNEAVLVAPAVNYQHNSEV